MFQVVAILAVLATAIAIVLAIRKQSKVTQALTEEEKALNAKVFERSSLKVEANVAEALAEKARDPAPGIHDAGGPRLRSPEGML